MIHLDSKLLGAGTGGVRPTPCLFTPHVADARPSCCLFRTWCVCAPSTRSVVIGGGPCAQASTGAAANVEAALKEEGRAGVDAVVCAAGAWAGGGVGDADGLNAIDAMLQANLKSAVRGAPSRHFEVCPWYTVATCNLRLGGGREPVSNHRSA